MVWTRAVESRLLLDHPTAANAKNIKRKIKASPKNKEFHSSANSFFFSFSSSTPDDSITVHMFQQSHGSMADNSNFQTHITYENYIHASTREREFWSFRSTVVQKRTRSNSFYVFFFDLRFSVLFLVELACKSMIVQFFDSWTLFSSLSMLAKKKLRQKCKHEMLFIFISFG